MSTNTELSGDLSNQYVVHYAFAYPESELRPADQRWGNGSIYIKTDKEPTTDEEFKEIARYIGKEGGYEAVGVLKVEAVEEEPESPTQLLQTMQEDAEARENKVREDFAANVVIEGTLIDDGE